MRNECGSLQERKINGNIKSKEKNELRCGRSSLLLPAAHSSALSSFSLSFLPCIFKNINMCIYVFKLQFIVYDT